MKLFAAERPRYPGSWMEAAACRHDHSVTRNPESDQQRHLSKPTVPEATLVCGCSLLIIPPDEATSVAARAVDSSDYMNGDSSLLHLSLAEKLT